MWRQWLLVAAYSVSNILLYPLSGLIAYRLWKSDTAGMVIATWILYNAAFVLLIWIADTYGSWWHEMAVANLILSLIPQLILTPFICRWTVRRNDE